MSNCQKKTTKKHKAQKALKVSAKARYALRIIKDIADNQNGNESTTEAAIAKRQGISQKFLSRIVLPLRDAGILNIQRGSHDGFTLRRKLEDISLLDIIETVQGSVSILDCLDNAIDCGRKRNCFARHIWAKANEEIRKSLGAIKLNEAE